MTKAQVSSQTVINALPDQSRRMVLYSLVGSLNSTIINTAASLAARIGKDTDFKELSARDVEQYMNEPDWRMDTLLDTRRALNVVNNLRDQLVELANDDDICSMREAISYRSRPAPVRNVDRKRLKETLIATRIVKADVKDDEVERYAIASMNQQKLDNERSAERIAGMAGAIEWIIDHVFTNPERGLEEPDNIEDLPRALQANLFDTIRNKIDAERIAAVTDLTNARRTPRYSIADATLLADCADMADMLTSHHEEEAIS